VAVEREFGYARADDEAYIAYVTAGDGPIDLVWQFDWLGTVEVCWEVPDFALLFEGVAGFSRLILHDRRATGLSSRNMGLPDLETRVSDLVAVLDAVGADRPVLGGEREGGAPNVMLAASQPDRARSIVWYAPAPRSVWAPDYPWGVRPEYVEKESELFEIWGTGAYGDAFIANERMAGHDLDPSAGAVVAKLARHTMTPDVAEELSRIWYETDIRPLLPTVRTPTLLLGYEETEDSTEPLGYVTSLLPDARSVVLPGSESDRDFGTFLDAIQGFLGVDKAPSQDTVLATVLFTDIVGSTQTQASRGDRGWKDLIERHHAIVRDSLARYQGQEQDTAGDGFFARFDGPARAIRCAQEITRAVRDLGIEVRAGVHTGECEIADGKCSGLSVSIGARVMSMAGASEVLVSQTVKDLVAGSGLSFEDTGEHELKGVPDRWRLYRVVDR
jgi:class 3 adenylate cyclase/pimeloyl-ACP methyl ester carboxylesterase